jgi:hypothetical protein
VFAAVRGDDSGAHRSMQVQQLPDRLRESSAGGGELDPSGSAVEQGCAEVGLERADSAAEVWLSDVDARRGTTEMQILGDRAERLQLCYLHSRGLYLCMQ